MPPSRVTGSGRAVRWPRTRRSAEGRALNRRDRGRVLVRRCAPRAARRAADLPGRDGRREHMRHAGSRAVGRADSRFARRSSTARSVFPEDFGDPPGSARSRKSSRSPFARARPLRRLHAKRGAHPARRRGLRRRHRAFDLARSSRQANASQEILAIFATIRPSTRGEASSMPTTSSTVDSYQGETRTSSSCRSSTTSPPWTP